MSKTTLQGVLTILGGAVVFVLGALKTGSWVDPLALGTLATAVTAGLGLIRAQDSP